MPYILKEDRKKFKAALDVIKIERINNHCLTIDFPDFVINIIRYYMLEDFKEFENKKNFNISLNGKNIKDLLPEKMNSGDLNYFITEVIAHIINKKGKRYSNLNDLSGVLKYAEKVFCSDNIQEYLDDYPNEYIPSYDLIPILGLIDCCNKELYRVVTGPYEDEKINNPLNGPVIADVSKLGKIDNY